MLLHLRLLWHLGPVITLVPSTLPWSLHCTDLVVILCTEFHSSDYVAFEFFIFRLESFTIVSGSKNMQYWNFQVRPSCIMIYKLKGFSSASANQFTCTIPHVLQYACATCTELQLRISQWDTCDIVHLSKSLVSKTWVVSSLSCILYMHTSQLTMISYVMSYHVQQSTYSITVQHLEKIL